MTFTRDLAWQHLETLYRSSATYQFARYALGMNYKLLPPEVVLHAKRCLLDTLGCAIGAFDAPGRPICEAFVTELGGTPEATVFGSGRRTSAANATLINSFLVRFLDFNDLGGGGHNSDAIPAILAVAEKEKSGGRELLTSLVLSYELGARVVESGSAASAKDWVKKGWNFDARGGLTMPPVLGRLMGLDEEQIANAIGICASHSLPLGILDTDLEENTMSKDLRFGFVAYEALLSCMLAKRGFTGPVRIIEGENGFRQVILHGDMDLERLVDFSGWRILKTRFKSLPANGTTQGHVAATLALVNEHDLKPENIARVRIVTSLEEFKHTTCLCKKYPRNAETADHSSYYTNAIAIKERDFGPDSYEPAKFTDPVVLDLIEKMTVELDLTLPDRSHQVLSEITTTDGRKFQKRVEVPHGMGNDPLTDRELEDKFAKMADKYMPRQQVKRIIETVWNVEKLKDMSRLMALMVLPRR